MKKIGISLIIIGFLIPLFSFSQEKVLEINNNIHTNLVIASNTYYMILEIPKISLIREIFPIDNSLNNVDKNIYLHPDSSDKNFIFASHSGYGTHAYFKDLDKLELHDEVILYYQGNKLIYEIIDEEEQFKTGTLYLKEYDVQMITLITCSKNNKNTQKILYATLKSV